MPIDPPRTRSREKRTAILCLTENGLRTAERLAEHLAGVTLYIPARLMDRQAECMSAAQQHPLHRKYFDDWQETFREAFHKHSALVCVMAAGIVVRSLALLMVSKLTDPAVVVVDEKGAYAISLLSGHIGGANQLAREVAALLGGQAVITTASDVSGTSSVDLLAMDINALLDPPVIIKTINRHLAESKPVNLYSPWPLLKIPSGFQWQSWPEGSTAASMETEDLDKLLEPAVLLSPWKVKLDPDREWMQLIPRNLVLGIGCRKNITLAELEQAIDRVIEHFSLDENCICKLASIDFKVQDEDALQQLAERLQVPLLGFSAEEIGTLDGSYEPSAWVKEKVGVGGVCEPAARLASGRGLILVPKQKIGAVTISIAMEKSWWWDWDQAAGIS